LGHKQADTLVTPINDSFVDLDLIARINGKTMQVERPSVYSDMVWSLRKNRALNGQKPIDWFIVRNRLSHIRAQNREQVETILKQLERRFAFTYLDGLSERVIYRQLFLQGLTLLDLNKIPDFRMRYSHVSGRQEVRRLLNALGIKKAQTKEADKDIFDVKTPVVQTASKGSDKPQASVVQNNKAFDNITAAAA